TDDLSRLRVAQASRARLEPRVECSARLLPNCQARFSFFLEFCLSVTLRLCGEMVVVQLKEALTSAISRLTTDHVPSPRMNAELLLMFTLNCDRAHLYAHPERELTTDESSRYEAALKERARGVPAQYITGHQEFWGMDLIVTPAVLIPRPETQHVIETVLDCVGRAPSPASRLRLADVGTGSGCIALSLAKEFPQAEIRASDISPVALEIARANAARHQLENRIQFYE